MAVLKAIPCINVEGGFRYLEYEFKPVPVIDGPALDADIDLLLSLTARTYLVPYVLLWIFMGPEGMGLFLRRAASKELREAFEAEFARRHPLLAARTEVARARLTAVTVIKGARATMPELIFSEAIYAVIPAGVRHWPRFHCRSQAVLRPTVTRCAVITVFSLMTLGLVLSLGLKSQV